MQTVTPDQPNLAFIPAATDGLELEVVEGRTKPNLQGWYCGGGPRPTPAPCVTYRRAEMLSTIFQTVLLPVKANQAVTLKVEPVGVSSDGWIRIVFPDGREDIYCSSEQTGHQQLGGIAFTGDAALIRRDSDGTLLDWGGYWRRQPTVWRRDPCRYARIKYLVSYVKNSCNSNRRGGSPRPNISDCR